MNLLLGPDVSCHSTFGRSAHLLTFLTLSFNCVMKKISFNSKQSPEQSECGHRVKLSPFTVGENFIAKVNTTSRPRVKRMSRNAGLCAFDVVIKGFSQGRCATIQYQI